MDWVHCDFNLQFPDVYWDHAIFQILLSAWILFIETLCFCWLIGVFYLLAYESYSEHIYEPLLWLSSKKSACNARGVVDMGSIPESGRSPGGGNSNILQYSSQENTMDREAWWAQCMGSQSQTLLSTVHGIAHGRYLLLIGCLPLHSVNTLLTGAFL